MDKTIPGLDSELTKAIVGTLSEPIVILDKDLRVVVASRAFYETFGVKYEDIRGKNFYELGDGEWNIPALRPLLEQIFTEKTAVEGYEIEHNFKTLGHRVMVINARELVFENDARRNILLVITDVTDAHKTDRDKENLMLQKDVLLKEMRHRIANSLQLIASIIFMKASGIKSKNIRADLEDASDQILSIATVQRNLEPTSEGSMVPVTNYLTILCESLARSMIGGRKPITLKVIGGTGVVKTDEAIGMGIITTELVMNALKHAFPKGEGQVTVVYESDKEKSNWKLSVGDDGIGLKASVPADHEGLGTSIIESISAQLNASVVRESTSRGTVVSITHPPAVARTT